MTGAPFMSLQQLIDRIASTTTDLAAMLAAGKPVPALNLRRSARMPVLAALHSILQRPIVLITDRADHA